MTDDLIWYEHDKPEDAYVFSRDRVDEIKALSKKDGWDLIPTRVIPATWNQGITNITGEEIHITELPKKENK